MTPVVIEGGRHSGPKQFLRLGMHYNDGLELVYIHKGRTVWKVEDRAVPVGPGELFFTLPWEKHGGLIPDQPGLEIDWIILNVGKRKGELIQPPSLGFPVRMWSSLTTAFLETETRCLPAPGMLGTFIRRVEQLRNKSDPESRLVKKALLQLILFDLSTAIRSHQPSSRYATDTATLQVRNLVETLKQDPGKGKSLPEMAAACGLGRSRFSDLFKQITGDSPIQFINRIKIQKACRLLEKTETPVTDIAFETGFESSQYFSRLFRSFLKCSPTEYRATSSVSSREHR